MTDMGTKAFQEMGLTKEMAIELKASVELEDSVAGILKLSDNATKEKTSGKFWDWDGKVLPW
jgi:norsolorinic acid ketoreductase